MCIHHTHATNTHSRKEGFYELGMVTLAYNTRISRGRGRAVVLGHPQLHSKLEASLVGCPWDSVLNNKRAIVESCHVDS
ncbi:mCG147029 [Mus musculus]|nr:mCG147029 [Mus musculus]